MKFYTLILIGFAGALSFGGCSSKSSSSADICLRAYDMIASRAEKCGDRPAGDKDRYLATCQAQLDLPGSGITAEWADACSSALEKAACGESDVPECEEQEGELAAGEACSSDIQCASGECNDVEFESDGTIMCGTCDKRKSSSSSPTPTTKEEGETCLTVSETSTTYENCAKGLYCDTLGTKECKALVANGKACEVANACESGRCAKGKCADKAEAGDVCEVAASGYSNDCVLGLACDPDKKECVKKTYADPGDDCDSNLVDCKKGFCNSKSELDPDTQTYVTTGTCPKILKDGASCDTSDQSATCDDYARCVGGKCRLIDSLACVEGSGASKGSDDTSTTTTKAAAKPKLKSAFGLFLSRH